MSKRPENVSERKIIIIIIVICPIAIAYSMGQMINSVSVCVCVCVCVCAAGVLSDRADTACDADDFQPEWQDSTMCCKRRTFTFLQRDFVCRHSL